MIGRKGYYTELADWASSRGYATLRVDGVATPTDRWPRLDRFKEHDIELPVAEIDVEPAAERELAAALERALALGNNMVRVLELRSNAAGVAAEAAQLRAAGARNSSATRSARRRAAAEISQRGKSRARRGAEAHATAAPETDPQGELFSTERACTSCGRSFEPLDPRLFSYNSRYGWCPSCFGTGVELTGFDGEQTGEESQWLEAEAEPEPCAACGGRRLKPEALAVTLAGRSIARAHGAVGRRVARVLRRGSRSTAARATSRATCCPSSQSRLGFLELVGLGYLTLDRAAPTLSGGEAQRIRLAAQLGSNLRGVCYILDEPTIGLHPRDNDRLLDTIDGTLRRAATRSSSSSTTRRRSAARSTSSISGPGAGRNGGEVVVNGTLADLLASERSTTGRVLASPPRHPLQPRRAVPVPAQSARRRSQRLRPARLAQ